MREHDPLVLSYVHLARLSRADEALRALRKVASLVKPIMRARQWKVKELAEFYPSQTNLLGLNVDRGRKICLRLRYPGDQNQFLPVESVVDTMLHELCHIVHGPHNKPFHALWNQLRDEQQGLFMKGYTGEGFLSEGHRLGGPGMPPREARRLAREAVEKRRRQPTGTGPGQRLGGAAPKPGEDIRKVIADAVQRRNETLKGCATEKLSGSQIRDLADTATRNGFRTQAEEDEANEIAIAQAMWDLVQEDEQTKYGNSYIPPSAKHPTGNGGGSVMPSEPGPSKCTLQEQGEEPAAVAGGTIWVCQVCTLHNPQSFLCCDACGAERSQEQTRRMAERANSKPVGNSRPVTIDLTNSPPQRSKGKRRRVQDTSQQQSSVAPNARQTWQCRFCSTKMERQWWTCSACGLMKDNSR